MPKVFLKFKDDSMNFAYDCQVCCWCGSHSVRDSTVIESTAIGGVGSAQAEWASASEPNLAPSSSSIGIIGSARCTGSSVFHLLLI
jgi:hypothetical protein